MARRSRVEASKRRDPAAVSDVIQDLVVQRGWQKNLALGRLKSMWSEVVGAQIAARSEPMKLDNGRLTIQVEGGAWAAELALMGPSITSAVAGFLGRDLVQEVSIVAGSWRRPDRGPEGAI
jgi:predicted nucleic acid-binding Zn ribbon protein